MTSVRSLMVATAGVAVAGVVGAGAVWAAPSTPTTLTYHLTNCTGSRSTLDGVKQPGEAAALHLTDDSGNFVFMEASDAVTGEVFFSTRGFAHNGIPTVDCDLTHPVSGEKLHVKGLVTPAKK